MSAVVAAPYASQILRNHYPLQSAELWFAYAAELTAIAAQLRAQIPTQEDLSSSVASMSGKFITSARQVVGHRWDTLCDSIRAYEECAREADAVARRISATKDALDGIVREALNKINQAIDEANRAKAQAQSRPLTAGAEIAAIESKLRTDIQAIITAAQGQVDAVDAEAAGNTTGSSLARIQGFTPNAKEAGKGAATPLSTGMGQGAASPPLSPGAGSNIRPTDYTTMKDGAENTTDRSSEKLQPTTNNGKTDQTMKSDEARNSAKIEPAAATTTNPDKPSPAHSSPPMSSAPSSGGSPASSAGSPSSMIGQMMPRSMSSSPASSGGSPASSGSGLSSGGPASASPAAAHAGGPGSPAGAGAPGGGAGAGAAPGSASGVRPAGLAGVGSGISESSARFASGAVNATTNALGAAGNLGSQVAQGAASAASAAAPPAAASAPVSGAPVGGAPIGMMPAAAAGGPGAGAPVTGGAPAVGGAPAATPAGAASPVSSVGGATPAASGSALAPVPLNTSPGVRGVGADGATGDALFEQAADVGRDVVSSLMAQTVWAGHITINYAVALVYEQGAVAAWMATSEGASYIPLGVRIPADVKLSVTDPVIGRTLWESSAKAGGANPLDVVVRQAQEREMAAPGSRVLAIASSLPMDQVMDWAAEVSARPVAVDPKSITKQAAVDMAMAHRCAVAMPWEWNQANRFDESERRRVAARHGYMAMTAGGLSSGPCEEVVELFDAGQPIPESLWHEVAKARMKPLTEYMLQMQSAGQGGAQPARALAAARAAEVVLCLRHSSTAEGCADLLYATRLAGAPLNQTAAVT